MLQYSASAEAVSEHPLALAVLTEAKSQGIELLPLESFEAITGRGIEASIDGAEILVGSPRFISRARHRYQPAR